MTRRTLLTLPLALAADTPLRWLSLNQSGDVRNSNWPDGSKPVCLGSLLKPYLALAFLTTHQQSPVIECRGSAAGCWHRQGHGRQDLISALANSCNVYFLQLAANVNRAALDTTCLSYGLASPARDWTPARLIGLDEGWPQAPLVAAQAFAALARNASDAPVRTVLSGMQRCARSGTARAVNLPCFAKTGTARCSHVPGDFVDGYIVAIYPTDEPRNIILAMRHNTSGARAAGLLRNLITE